MNKHYFKLFILFLSMPFFNEISAQIKIGLVQNESSNQVEFYMIHEDASFKSDNTFLGTGQITVLVDTGTDLENVRSISGVWMKNAHVKSPKENVGKDYISFGFPAGMQIPLAGDQPTLLFVADLIGSSQVELIGTDDPFAQLPNSVNTNPGNELTMIDYSNNLSLIDFCCTYTPCEENPSDCENIRNLALKNADNNMLQANSTNFADYIIGIQNEEKKK